MKAGNSDKVYYVHPGVFAESALCTQSPGSWTDTGDDTIDLTEYDEQTIENVLSYLYTKDYGPPQVAEERDSAVVVEARRDDSRLTGNDLPQENINNGTMGSIYL